MLKLILSLSILVIMGLLAAACTPLAENAKPLSNEEETQSIAEQPLIASDQGATPGIPGGEDEPGKTDPSGGDIVSSEGDVISSPPGGQASGSDSSSGPLKVQPPQKPANWRLYVDETYGFSVEYPDTYVILDEIVPLSDVAPGMVQRVRFQDKKLAKGPTADIEPPQFSIEVYEIATPDLAGWLSTNAPHGERSQINLGNVTCTKVELMTLIAPNMFYYCQGGKYMYALTPLGPYTDQMLRSFKITQ